jgi:hypothetical protein
MLANEGGKKPALVSKKLVMEKVSICLGRRLIDMLLLHSSFIDNLGLLNGKTGIAVFFYHLARQTGNSVYEDYIN